MSTTAEMMIQQTAAATTTAGGEGAGGGTAATPPDVSIDEPQHPQWAEVVPRHESEFQRIQREMLEQEDAENRRPCSAPAYVPCTAPTHCSSTVAGGVGVGGGGMLATTTTPGSPTSSLVSQVSSYCNTSCCSTNTTATSSSMAQLMRDTSTVDYLRFYRANAAFERNPRFLPPGNNMRSLLPSSSGGGGGKRNRKAAAAAVTSNNNNNSGGGVGSRNDDTTSSRGVAGAYSIFSKDQRISNPEQGGPYQQNYPPPPPPTSNNKMDSVVSILNNNKSRSSGGDGSSSSTQHTTATATATTVPTSSSYLAMEQYLDMCQRRYWSDQKDRRRRHKEHQQRNKKKKSHQLREAEKQRKTMQQHVTFAPTSIEVKDGDDDDESVGMEEEEEEGDGKKKTVVRVCCDSSMFLSIATGAAKVIQRIIRRFLSISKAQRLLAVMHMCTSERRYPLLPEIVGCGAVDAERYLVECALEYEYMLHVENMVRREVVVAVDDNDNTALLVVGGDADGDVGQTDMGHAEEEEEGIGHHHHHHHQRGNHGGSNNSDGVVEEEEQPNNSSSRKCVLTEDELVTLHESVQERCGSGEFTSDDIVLPTLVTFQQRGYWWRGRRGGDDGGDKQLSTGGGGGCKDKDGSASKTSSSSSSTLAFKYELRAILPLLRAALEVGNLTDSATVNLLVGNCLAPFLPLAAKEQTGKMERMGATHKNKKITSGEELASGHSGRGRRTTAVEQEMEDNDDEEDVVGYQEGCSFLHSMLIGLHVPSATAAMQTVVTAATADGSDGVHHEYPPPSPPGTTHIIPSQHQEESHHHHGGSSSSGGIPTTSSTVNFSKSAAPHHHHHHHYATDAPQKGWDSSPLHTTGGSEQLSSPDDSFLRRIKKTTAAQPRGKQHEVGAPGPRQISDIEKKGTEEQSAASATSVSASSPTIQQHYRLQDIKGVPAEEIECRTWDELLIKWPKEHDPVRIQQGKSIAAKKEKASKQEEKPSAQMQPPSTRRRTRVTNSGIIIVDETPVVEVEEAIDDDEKTPDFKFRSQERRRKPGRTEMGTATETTTDPSDLKKKTKNRTDVDDESEGDVVEDDEVTAAQNEVLEWIGVQREALAVIVRQRRGQNRCEGLSGEEEEEEEPGYGGGPAATIRPQTGQAGGSGDGEGGGSPLLLMDAYEYNQLEKKKRDASHLATLNDRVFRWVDQQHQEQEQGPRSQRPGNEEKSISTRGEEEAKQQAGVEKRQAEHDGVELEEVFNMNIVVPKNTHRRREGLRDGFTTRASTMATPTTAISRTTREVVGDKTCVICELDDLGVAQCATCGNPVHAECGVESLDKVLFCCASCSREKRGKGK